MTEPDRKKRNEDRIAECWPVFGNKVRAILEDLSGHGFRPRIQDAWRSPVDQLAAYNSGHSKLRFGFHNVTAKSGRKEALAVDILDDDHPNQESKRFLLMLASSAASHDLETGIDWGLPQKLKDAITDAITAKDWGAPVKISWDPCHVQPYRITPKQAKQGMRI